MKKKILIMIIRLIKFFKKENELMPELMSVDQNKIRTERLYQHFGRIVYARKNDVKVNIKYMVDGEECSDIKYNESVRENEVMKKEVHKVEMKISGKPCNKCACSIYSLPCRCDFTSGTFTGYYEIVKCSKQYSDNIKL